MNFYYCRLFADEFFHFVVRLETAGMMLAVFFLSNLQRIRKN